MDVGILDGLWTLVLLVAFAGIVYSAFHPRRKADLEAAARLAVDDERPGAARDDRRDSDG